jgi:glyoxylate reductase
MSSLRPRVFVTQPVAAGALDRLRAAADVDVNPESSRILAKARLCRTITKYDVLFALLHDIVDRDVLTANPKLKCVASMAITPDNIDVAEATARGIAVTVIPAVVSEATADLAIGLMIAVGRRIVQGDHLLRSGAFPGSQSNHLAGVTLSGKVLGLVGCGRIGQAVARRAQGFGMRLLYCDPRRMPEDEELKLGLTYVSLEEVLGQSDFISLHPSLNSETQRMISVRQFALMKKSAFLINTSRGAVVDETALVMALAEGRLAGAGLDVYENEPRVEPALLKMDNVVLTPHLGSAVAELRESMAHVVVDNILAIIEGRKPPNCINPEVFSAGAFASSPEGASPAGLER